jgi:hypothetical protein
MIRRLCRPSVQADSSLFLYVNKEYVWEKSRDLLGSQDVRSRRAVSRFLVSNLNIERQYRAPEAEKLALADDGQQLTGRLSPPPLNRRRNQRTAGPVDAC